MESQSVAQQWKYQRQFDYGDGVATQVQRPDLLRETTPRLLDDGQLRQFLANGFLLLQPDLPLDFHQDLYSRFERIVGDDNDDNPGNNLLPLVPELQLVFDDPVVKGALTSVLGDNYLMHPHRVLHDNPPGSDPQVWHHDSYWGYKRKVHNHHPWWVMIMYYPQDIYEAIGPTGVIPGSHCIAQRLEDIEQLGIGASGKAGTCMMIHYDIWHRKMKNLTQLKRFMVKFEFIRMQRPDRVTWDSRETEWRNPERVPGYAMEPMWRAHWHWIGHRTLSPAAVQPDLTLRSALDRLESPDSHVRAEAVCDIAKLGDAASVATDTLVGLLGDDSEVVGLNAAYTLAAFGAVEPLVTAMRGNDGINVDDARCFIDEGQKSELEMIARNAAHGLAAIGAPAIPALLDGAASGGPRVRKYACFALGEADSDDPAVIAALIAGCRDEDPAVRLNAVEALGLKKGSDAAALALADALSDEDDEVRFNAALALARLGPAAAPAVPALRQALTDGNRYTMGYAVEALDRIGTPEALKVLVPFLRIARWCPVTTKDSLF
ncbi:MAG: HEAT repeat domain-containing protein [Alphaproteobacteria bacterium]